MNESALT